MKPSKYNFFFPIEKTGNFLAFNSLKNGLTVFPETLVHLLQHMEAGDSLPVSESILAQLQKGGFVCDDAFDEYGLLQIRRHLQQYGGSFRLGLTIAPTLNCNLFCSYCFETPQPAIMDGTVIAQLVEMVEGRIKNGLKHLSIQWYGGESLLCIDIVEELSQKLMAICETNQVEYTAHIITNGTLFTRAYAEKLKTLKVTGAQITLDGDQPFHDARRPYRGGKGSFNTIFANIIDAAGVLPISLRVNVDRMNVDSVLDFFKGMQADPRLEPFFKKGDIHIHYGHVRKYSASCRCSDEECLKDGEFWQEELKLHQYLCEKRIATMPFPSFGSGCSATTVNGYVVGPRGELYKCWNHIGRKEKEVGHIGKEISMNALYISYLTESFENDAQCREQCKLLPICMGGCVDIRINYKKGTFPAIDCTRWKYYLEESVKAYYLASLKKSAAAKDS